MPASEAKPEGCYKNLAAKELKERREVKFALCSVRSFAAIA